MNALTIFTFDYLYASFKIIVLSSLNWPLVQSLWFISNWQDILKKIYSIEHWRCMVSKKRNGCATLNNKIRTFVCMFVIQRKQCVFGYWEIVRCLCMKFIQEFEYLLRNCLVNSVHNIVFTSLHWIYNIWKNICTLYNLLKDVLTDNKRLFKCRLEDINISKNLRNGILKVLFAGIAQILNVIKNTHLNINT